MITERSEFTDFLIAWQDKPQLQVIEELASLAQETKRIPDAYLFEEDKDGDLYSPTIRAKVSSIIKRDNRVGELEGRAFDKINSWFKANEEGASLWISPPDSEFYFTSKIIISEIKKQDAKKILFNRAVLLDLDGQECLELAKGLSDCSLNRPLLSSISEVRANPLFLRSHWKNILQENILAPDVWGMVDSGYDIQSKEEALKQAKILYPSLFGELAIFWARDSGFFGEFDSSCPIPMGGKGAFGVFLNHSVAPEGCKKIRCPKCGWEPGTEELKKVQSGEITSCPQKNPKGESCGWKPGEGL